VPCIRRVGGRRLPNEGAKVTGQSGYFPQGLLDFDAHIPERRRFHLADGACVHGTTAQVNRYGDLVHPGRLATCGVARRRPPTEEIPEE
jgi:hypothetical protein